MGTMRRESHCSTEAVQEASQVEEAVEGEGGGRRDEGTEREEVEGTAREEEENDDDVVEGVRETASSKSSWIWSNPRRIEAPWVERRRCSAVEGRPSQTGLL